MTIVLKRTVEFAESEDEGSILLDTARGVYWHLNSVGAMFVRGIQADKSVSEVTALIAQRFTVDRETVRRDISELVRGLKKARLIEVRDE